MKKRTKQIPIAAQPSEAAFNLGRDVVRFDWYSRILTFTGSTSAAHGARACLENIEQNLVVLLPSSARSRDYLRELGSHVDHFDSRDVTEQVADTWSEARRSPEQAVTIIDDELRLNLPAEWDRLWSGLTSELQVLDQLYQWINLGRCLEQGLCPPLHAKDLVCITDNPQWNRWALHRQQRPRSFLPEPLREIATRRIPGLGEIPPASSWTVELSALWRALALPSRKLLVTSPSSAKSRRADNAGLARIAKSLVPCPESQRKGATVPVWVKGTRWCVSPQLDAFAIHGQDYMYRVKMELQVLNVLAESDEAPSSEDIVDQIPDLKVQVQRHLDHLFDQRIDRFRPLRSVIGKLNDQLAEILKLGKRRLITSQRRGQKRHVWTLEIPPLAGLQTRNRRAASRSTKK